MSKKQDDPPIGPPGYTAALGRRQRWTGAYTPEFFGGESLGPESLGSRDWLPSVDISELEDSFVLSVDLPGVAKEDISISLENNVLTIQGARDFKSEEGATGYHRIEKAYGQFSRSFSLPSAVQPGRVKANLHQGVLTIEVPKSEAARPRKIAID